MQLDLGDAHAAKSSSFCDILDRHWNGRCRLKLLTDKLDPGDYRLELQAKDSVGGSSSVRTADFQME